MRRYPLQWTPALLLLAACQSDVLAPKAPSAAPLGSARSVGMNVPALGPSIIDAPISYAVAPMLTALEAAVPRRFGNIEHRIAVPANARQAFAFSATRSPFVIGFDGTRVTLSTDVSYEGRAWYNPPLAPTVSASCGVDGRRPRLHLVFATDLQVSEDWVLRGATRLRSLRAKTDDDVDQCRVTLLKINVTDRVVDALRPQLQRRLSTVDRRIAGFDLRGRVERWYNLLNKSIRVRDSLWLRIAPEDVRLGGLHLDDTALVADIRLYARPVLITGARPADITTSLPPLKQAARAVGDSSHLLLEGRLGYDAASTVVAAQLVGRSMSRFGRRITVRDARFDPLNDGRVVLALQVDGAVSGKAYFVGTPTVDTTSGVLSVPDLDFDVQTADALVQGLAWLKKGDLVAELRRRAKIPLQPILDETRTRVEDALNRDLAEGVRLSGVVRSGRVIDVTADPQFLVVRAEAIGSLGLGIDRELKVRRKR